MRKIVFLLTIAFLFMGMLNAAIINIPDDYATIQEGINSAEDGDTVLVADGVYTGMNNKNLTWDGDEKHIIVKSQNGPENCIIDCEDDGRAFYFDSTNQDTTDVIDGFTMKNGFSNCGSGFYCRYSSPKIMNNIIKENLISPLMGGGSGAGIYCYHSSSIIRDNLITSNNIFCSGMPGFGEGAGLCILYGAPIIENNDIINNEITASDLECFASGAGLNVLNSSSQIKNNLIKGNSTIHQFEMSNSGGGMYCINYQDSSMIILNNTIVSNHSAKGGGVLINGYIIFDNNICCNNSDDGIYWSGIGNVPKIEYNEVYDNTQNFIDCPPGIGDTTWGNNINGTSCDSCHNIIEDPLFVNPYDGNFHLTEGSPCIDAGDPNSPLDPDGTIADMGAYHYHQPASIDEPEYNSNIIWNSPNPTKNATTIQYFLKQNSHVKISIYNIKGQLISTFINEYQIKGKHSVIYHTDTLKSGVYFYKVEAGELIKVKKLVVIQ
ncbi:MAG: T9SS type A sorting domain-containing protein [Candidatus Cloacimonetes bacterium]|nr:T9SS type A sorting domain-containing protein [Candidatus Cloacimonadota bacterium]